MKTQIFLDGNKRASVIFANHYLISHGGGFLVIPEKKYRSSNNLLVKYYEGNDIKVIADFMKEHLLEKQFDYKKLANLLAFLETNIV